VQVSLVSVSLASSLLVFPGWRGGTLIMLTVSLVWPLDLVFTIRDFVPLELWIV
jgi:hypothetical protein